MSSSQGTQTASDSSSERRRCERQLVIGPALIAVEFDGQENLGLMTDLSEDGVAVQAVVGLRRGSQQTLRWRFSPDDAPIEVGAQVVWSRGKLSGLQFVGVKDEVRIRIRQWLRDLARENDASGEIEDIPAEETCVQAFPVTASLETPSPEAAHEPLEAAQKPPEAAPKPLMNAHVAAATAPVAAPAIQSVPPTQPPSPKIAPAPVAPAAASTTHAPAPPVPAAPPLSATPVAPPEISVALPAVKPVPTTQATPAQKTAAQPANATKDGPAPTAKPKPERAVNSAAPSVRPQPPADSKPRPAENAPTTPSRQAPAPVPVQAPVFATTVPGGGKFAVRVAAVLLLMVVIATGIYVWRTRSTKATVPGDAQGPTVQTVAVPAPVPSTPPQRGNADSQQLPLGTSTSQPQLAVRQSTPAPTTKATPARNYPDAALPIRTPSPKAPPTENGPDAPPQVVGQNDTQFLSRIVTPTPKLPQLDRPQTRSSAPSRLVSRIQPSYPPAAIAAGFGGVVILELTVGKDGRVKTLRTVSGNPVLAQAAIDAARRWRYRPAEVDGEPVEETLRVTLRFILPTSGR